MSDSALKNRTARIPSPPEFSETGRRVGDYQLGQVIGGGGMGTVYLARQISMHRVVALKLLRHELVSDPTYMERFFQEVRLLAQLENPGVVQAIEVGMDRGISFFSMEYAAGSDLRTLLESSGKFTEREVLEIARQAAHSLAYAWRKFKLVHRDIKPANLMLTQQGKIKILDFGISKKLAGQGDNPKELTTVHSMIGSPTYMSPEQARSQKDIDFRADLYSLGITMYHLLAGHPPYESPSSMEVVAMHISAAVPDIREMRSSISKAMAGLLQRMLAKNPDDRFDSWEALLDELDTVERQLDVLEREEAKRKERHLARQKKAESLRLRPHQILALSLLLLMIILLVVIFAVRKNRTAAEVSVSGENMEMEIPAAGSTAVSAIAAGAAASADLSAKKMDQLRTDELHKLIERSTSLEKNKDFVNAILIWESYVPPAGLEQDAVLKNRIADQIRYLRERHSRQLSGLDD